MSEYDRAGTTSEQEAEEMFALAKRIRRDVEAWLAANHPELMGE